MREEIEEYVRTCLVFQQDKVAMKKQAELLEPLPIPERPWANVSMDIISALPKARKIGSIMVVVDNFSMYAAPTNCTVEETTRLFVLHIVKYWGIPENIVSDRGPHFTRRFWIEVFKPLGSELHFSASFHLQTDGQAERVNALLEELGPTSRRGTIFL